MLEKKILIVDDEVDLVQLYRLVLELAGYQVRGATSGRQALQMYNQDTPHLVILDVMMPEMDGIEVCKKMRETDQTGLSKIIMYTANDSQENRLASEEAGADELVSKQVSIDELTDKIAGYFSQQPA